MFISKKRESVLAIDAGTTSIKAAVIDREYRVSAVVERPTPVSSPEPGQRELDMDLFGDRVFETLTAALEKVDPRSIAGISITGQGDGAWLVDDQTRPVGPAILWNDARSAEVLAHMLEDGEVERIQSTTHGSVHPGSLAVVARFLREKDPQRLAQVRHHLHCKDWVRYLLTGVLEAEASDACRSYLNTTTQEWDIGLMEELGDLSPDTTLPLADSRSTRALASPAASRLGLLHGLPVSVGMMDVAAAGYAFCGDQPDRAWAIVGTTSFVGVVRTHLDASAGHWMAYGSGQLMLNSLAPMTGTPLLEWAKRLVGQENEKWDSFADFARSGSKEGVRPLLLPYFSPSGERSPFSDPFARGSLHGLTYDTTPENFAWSVFAGIALGIAECIEKLRISDPVCIAGGGGSSDLLCQLIADYSGRVLERSELSAEAGLIGAVRKLHTSLGIEASPAPESPVAFEPELESTEREESLNRLRAARESERSNWQMLAGRARSLMKGK